MDDNQLENMLDETRQEDQVLQEVPEAQAAPEPQPTDAERNFAALREKYESERKAREKYERESEEWRTYYFKNQQQTQVQQPQEPQPAADEFADVAYVNRRIEQQVKTTEERLREYEARLQEVTAENRLKSQYPDFDEVVNTQNISLLKDLHPELAATIHSNNDLYTKASAAYKMIKKFGIVQEPIVTENRQRIQENMERPKAVQSVQRGESPLTEAANWQRKTLSRAEKAAINKQRESARRGYL